MRKPYILTIFFIAFVLQVNAQLSYSFNAISSTYTPLSSGTSPTLLATTSGGNTDEGYANNIAIGFNFTYNNITYTNLGICTNGFVYLGGNLVNSSVTYINNLSTELATVRPIIAPLWDDIDVQSVTNIKYLVTGVAPNRILTIEWANALWDPFAAAAAISFQLKLYETTNIIEFLYKQEAGAIENNFGGVGASIGLTNGSTGDGNYLSLNNSSNNPTISNTVNTTNISTKPANGQLYRFTPIDSCTGKPNSGIASSSILASCANTPFNLYLTAFSNTAGISMQWQSSVTGQNIWMDMANIDSSFETISQNNASDYRCIVTCAKSGLKDTSNIITVGLIAANVCSMENDECASAILISQTPYNVNCSGSLFNTSLATQSSNNSQFFSGSQDDDIWFKFVATSDKAVIRFSDVYAVSGILSNIQFAFYTGNNCGSLTDFGGKTITLHNGEGEVLYHSLTVGNTYYIRVASEGVNWRVAGKICISDPQISAGSNNTCLTLTSTESTNNNNTIWIPIYDGSKLVAEINAQGNTMGIINSKLFVTDVVRTFSGNGRAYLSRNLEITPTTQPSTNVKVRIYVLNSEIAELALHPSSLVNTLADLYITKNNDVCSANYNGSGVFILPTSRVSYANGGYIEFETSSFSSFYIHGGLGVLPVTIQNFKGEQNGYSNILKWQTIHESNNIGFDVQKSIDGKSFSSIAFVPTQSNYTSEIQKLNYVFEDKNVVAFTNYYRLKQTDKEGKTHYSNTISISSETGINPTKITVYPNPVSSIVNLNMYVQKPTNLFITITDIFGKKINQITITHAEGKVEKSINLNYLQKGIYVLKITDNYGTNYGAHKLVKQ